METNYILINPVHGGAGFFSYIWESLRAVYHNPNKHYYFYFGPESSYYDTSVTGFNNVWDYYFEQPHSSTFPSNNIEKYIRTIINEQESEYREGEEFNLDFDAYNKQRFVYNEIINKYYKLKPEIQQKIESFYSTHFVNKRVLGIHCRGTDHPNNKNIFLYLDKIEATLQDYDVLFAMSDEQGKIDALRERFGNKVVTYSTFRSMNNMPLHVLPHHTYNKRLLGEEVLVEAYLLARTDMLLLYTGSNVNFYSRALNPHLQYINL